MSPLAKALIAYTTKLRLVLYFHLLAANSSCANIQSMIWFLFLSGEGARAVHLQFTFLCDIILHQNMSIVQNQQSAFCFDKC